MEKWFEMLPETVRTNADALANRAMTERDAGTIIYPPQSQIFSALTLTPPENVRVVIVGQDPYHEPGQANGLAFSVSPGVPIPASLRNIFKELHEDLDLPIPASGDLTPWAKQGVLLLNTVLTVEKGKADSHKNWGWQKVVLSVLSACMTLPQPVVFILWGRKAQAFVEDLDFENSGNKKYICSSHPSPLGAKKGGAGFPAFIGSRPFSKTNELLTSMGANPVDWRL